MTTTGPAPPSAFPREGHDFWLWTAVLGAPFLWLTHLQLSYMLVPWCATHGNLWILHAISAVLLLLTLGGGLISYFEFRRAGSQESSPDTPAPLGRTCILAALGILNSGLFALAIIFQAIPSFILDPSVN